MSDLILDRGVVVASTPRLTAASQKLRSRIAASTDVECDAADYVPTQRVVCGVNDEQQITSRRLPRLMALGLSDGAKGILRETDDGTRYIFHDEKEHMRVYVLAWLNRSGEPMTAVFDESYYRCLDAYRSHGCHLIGLQLPELPAKIAASVAVSEDGSTCVIKDLLVTRDPKFKIDAEKSETPAAKTAKLTEAAMAKAAQIAKSGFGKSQ